MLDSWGGRLLSVKATSPLISCCWEIAKDKWSFYPNLIEGSIPHKEPLDGWAAFSNRHFNNQTNVDLNFIKICIFLSSWECEQGISFLTDFYLFQRLKAQTTRRPCTFIKVQLDRNVKFSVSTMETTCLVWDPAIKIWRKSLQATDSNYISGDTVRKTRFNCGSKAGSVQCPGQDTIRFLMTSIDKF